MYGFSKECLGARTADTRVSARPEKPSSLDLLTDTCTHLSLLCPQGLRKRELLKELLPVIGQNLRFQRLFTECQEQLDILRDK